jgi:hypothetical protein
MATSSGVAFDNLLISTADVLTRDTVGEDARGMADPTFTVVATGVPCRVSMGKTVGKGKENRAKAKEQIAYREVFMRPWFADPSPDGSYVPYVLVGGVNYNTEPLTHDHWLRIPSPLIVNGVTIYGDLYDIFDVQNPGLLNDHLEVWCQLVLV